MSILINGFTTPFKQVKTPAGKATAFAALFVAGLIAEDVHALDGDTYQFETFGSCQVRARIFNPQSADVTLVVPGDPTAGGTYYNNGNILDYTVLTQQHIEYCGFQNVTNFTTNGADSSFSADDYIGFSFTGSYLGLNGKYEAALKGINNTTVNFIKPAEVGSFYRQGNRPEVMYQFTSSHYCHVENEWQMTAYGGFNQVNIVPELNMSGLSTGTCGWPNGFYRRENQFEAYHLSGYSGLPNLGADICNVINEQQMALFGGSSIIMVVPSSSNLNHGRYPFTECINPF